MDCPICERIFAEIKDIDHRVNRKAADKEYYLDRLIYVQLRSVPKQTLEMLHERFERTQLEWKTLRNQQIEIHKSLTKHYREDHLNGTV